MSFLHLISTNVNDNISVVNNQSMERRSVTLREKEIELLTANGNPIETRGKNEMAEEVELQYIIMIEDLRFEAEIS